MAQSQGLEPWSPWRPTVFKTARLPIITTLHGSAPHFLYRGIGAWTEPLILVLKYISSQNKLYIIYFVVVNMVAPRGNDPPYPVFQTGANPSQLKSHLKYGGGWGDRTHSGQRQGIYSPFRLLNGLHLQIKIITTKGNEKLS